MLIENKDINPKVSVVTVCLNSAGTIERTVQSVLSQDYQDIEYIVIDGRSSDNTLNILKQYEDKISLLISEIDSGLYDAMNKGVRLSSGEFIFFINADDRFTDSSVISDFVRTYQENSELNFIYGDVLLESDSGNARISKQLKRLTSPGLCMTTICHQAIFCKKSLFDDIGYYSQEYKVVSDYEWIMRAYKKNKLKSKHIDRSICEIGTSGLTYTTSWQTEKRKVLLKYYNPLQIYLWRTLPRYLLPKVKYLKRRYLG